MHALELKEEETGNLVSCSPQNTPYEVIFDRLGDFRVYEQHTVQIGDDFDSKQCAELSDYDQAFDCVKQSKMCNVWINSDEYDVLKKGDIFYRCDNVIYYDQNANQYFPSAKLLWKIKYELYGMNYTRNSHIGYINVGRYGWTGTIQPFSEIDEDKICCITPTGKQNASNCWTFFSHFLSITMDILLIRQAFSINNTFRVLGIAFLAGPLLCASLWAAVDCHRRYEYMTTRIPKCLFNIPVINIPMLQCQKCMASDTFYGIALSGLQAYPFFIIQISFILETHENYSDISLLQLLSLAKSLLLLCVMPLLDVLRITYYQYQYKGFTPSTKDKICIFLRIIFLFSPIAFIEIIHFFPVLFSYFIDDTITYTQFVIVLLMLNVPKALFFVHMIKKWNWKDPERGWFIHSAMFVIITTVSITLPMLPYVMLMLHNYSIQPLSKRYAKSKRCHGVNRVYYICMIVYLWISYGSSLMYLFYCVDVNGNHLSQPVWASSWAILINVIFITLTIATSTKLVTKAKVTGIPLFEYYIKRN